MSVQAITWALEQAENVPAQCVSTLIGLANHADRDGSAAYPSTETLAGYTRKSKRSVQRDITVLLQAGIIRIGNQQRVAWLPADRRTVVYDLTMSDSEPVNKSVRDRARGDTDDVPQTGDGVTPASPRGDTHVADGVTPTSPEPSREPSKNRGERARDTQPATNQPDANHSPPPGGDHPEHCSKHKNTDNPPPCHACRKQRQALEQAPKAATVWPEHCGHCGRIDRMIELDSGTLAKCKRCHPHTQNRTTT